MSTSESLEAPTLPTSLSSPPLDMVDVQYLEGTDHKVQKYLCSSAHVH